MLLQFGALAMTMSWDDGFPGARASRPHDEGSFLGARASRPHQAWHSLGHLPHLDQPGTAPWVSFGLADGVPAHRVAACSIALKLSGGQRDRMRAGRPRSQAMPSRRRRGECPAGDFSEKGRPVGDVSSADLPRPRLRRSPLNHNTAGGWDFPIGFPREPGRDSSLAANTASAGRPLPKNAKHVPATSPRRAWLAAPQGLQLTLLLYSPMAAGTRPQPGHLPAAGKSNVRKQRKPSDGIAPQGPR